MIPAIDDGRNASDRSTASPRKMCVPGVHACAIDGVTAIAISATRAAQKIAVKGCRADSRRPKLDPDPLPLPPNRFPEVVHLRADNVIDRFLRAVDVLANRISDLIDRYGIGEISAGTTRRLVSASGALARPSCAVEPALLRPASSRSRMITGPARSFQSGECRPLCTLACRCEHGGDRTTAARAGSEDERDDGADCRAEQRRCQQVELLLTTLVFRIRLADGRAGAASATRGRLRCICHPDPPPVRMPHESRFARRAASMLSRRTRLQPPPAPPGAARSAP